MKTFNKFLMALVVLTLSAASHANFDEVVVTIYFSGTNLDSSMWNSSASAFGKPETVAALHHSQLSQPGHHKGIVEGITQNLVNDPFVPDWPAQRAAAAAIFDDRPACSGKCVILNLVGFSRGAVSTMDTAHDLYESESSIRKINIIAFDPVPGDRLRTSQIFKLSPITEYIGFYANDERSIGFAPVIPDGSDSSYPVDVFLVPGAHNTMVGSTYVNGARDDHFNDNGRLLPLSETLRIVATEIMGSAEWGRVMFAANGNGSVDHDWIDGETDIDVLRQRFLSDNLLPIFNSYYGFMRAFSLVSPLDVDLREGWASGDCLNASTADLARLSSRCVYTGGYNGTPIGQSDGPISGVSSLDWLDTIDNGEYRLWTLLTERGTLDTDGDGIDYGKDNCKVLVNADQTDTDGDGYGNACDADFNNDCVVNFIDFSQFADAFLGTNPLFDMTNDGVVNFLDLTVVVNAFSGVPGPGLSTGLCE